MDPEMRAKFIQVTDLLRCIGDGVGQANAGLWRYSASCVGMLAVKTARVTVDFEMTSEAVADTYGLPGPLALGAKTIYLTSASKEEREINRAQITLEIVSVAPEAPPPGEGASAPGGVAPEAPSAKDVQHKQNLLHMTKVMRAKILSTKRLSDKNRQTLAEGLDAAARLVHECRDKEACYLLLKVALKFQEELTRKDSPDKETTLGLIDVFTTNLPHLPLADKDKRKLGKDLERLKDTVNKDDMETARKLVRAISGKIPSGKPR